MCRMTLLHWVSLMKVNQLCHQIDVPDVAPLFSFFQDVGIKIITNSEVKRPYDCIGYAVQMSYNSEADGGKLSMHY